MKKITLLMVLMFSIFSIANAQNSKRNAAKNALDNGDLTKAKELIDIAVANDKTKEDAKTWLYYGMIYAQIGVSTDEAVKNLAPEALSKALDAYTKASSLDTKKQLYLQLSSNVMQLANTFYANGVTDFEGQKYQTAIDNFDNAGLANAVIDVVDTTTIYATALSAANGGMNEIAKEKFSELIDMNYNSAGIYSELANIYKKEESFEKAEEVLAKGRERYPNDNGILIAEINILLGQGRFDEVVAKLKHSIELEPENASLYLALGDSYKQLDDRENAIKYYNEALEVNPDYFLALYNLGVMYYQEAFDLNMQANDLPFDETEKYDKLIAESNEYFMQGLPYFEKAYEIDTTDPDVVKALRQIYTSTKQMDKLKKLNEEQQ